MSPSSVRPTQFGRIYAPDEAWLAKQPPETILEPDLPIVDTHHHLWERPDHRYLLHEFLDDVHTGHNVVATVFGIDEDLDLIKRYRDAGVARLIFNVPPAKADEVLPLLDRCAALMRQASACHSSVVRRTEQGRSGDARARRVA